MGGGAWPFLVGGVICLVNSDNERDSILLMLIKGSEAQSGMVRFEISTHSTYGRDNWGVYN